MKEKAGPSRPLRVALVITELRVGGAERCLTNLALGLNRGRFQPSVYSLGPRPSTEQEELVHRLESAKIPIHFLNLTSPRQFLQGVRGLRRLFIQHAPDIAQSFLFHANVLTALAGRRAGVRRIITGIRVADPRRSRLWSERVFTTRADRIVCVSQATADHMVTHGHFPEEKIVVIPNGIDVARYDNVSPADLAECGIGRDRRIMAVVGRLDRQKGLDWLLSLAPRLLSRIPDYDLVLVGDGPEREKLITLAQQSGYSERIHFLGWRKDVPHILAASTLLLLPSRWEGMPNVALEAMASRRPVVATQSEGTMELFGPLAEFQVVLFGDSEVFIEKAVRIATHPLLAERLGADNRKRAEKEFSLLAMIRRYEALFDEFPATQS